MSALWLWQASFPAYADFRVHRIGTQESSPTIDGKLDEPAWRKASEHDDFLEYFPREKAAPPVRTSVRILHDASALYIGIRAWDDGPARRRAPQVRRDQVLSDQDAVIVMIDPAGTRRFAQFFRINPSGSLGDGVYSADIGREDFLPDFDVEVATQSLEDGWTAELRIPFSELRYPEPMPQVWSMLVLRQLPRERLVRIASSPLPREPVCLLCDNRRLLGFESLRSEARWLVVPHLASHVGRFRDADGAGRETQLRPGLDFKWRPRGDWVVDGTLRPDFSQLELDTPQLAGNTRRALLYPEKRPFFLEGTDLLETPLAAVHTRSLGEPSWGLRATHRGERLELAMLSVQERAGGVLLLPSAYETVRRERDTPSLGSILRARMPWGPANLGVLVSDRQDDRLGGNRVLGPDLGWWVDRHNRLRMQWLLSDSDAAADGSIAATRGTARMLEWVHSSDAWSWTLLLDSLTQGFRADNGFFPEAGYRRRYLEISRRFYGYAGTEEISPYVRLEHKTDSLGRITTAGIRPGIWLGLARGTGVQIEAQPSERNRVTAEGPDFQRRAWDLYLETRPFAWLSLLQARLEVGERIDVWRERLENGYQAKLVLRLRPFASLQFEPTLLREALHRREGVDAGKRLHLEQSLQLKLYWQWTARQSLRLIWQEGLMRRSDFALGASPDYRTRTVSVVGAHLQGLNRAIYLGATRMDAVSGQGQDSRQRTEVFLNLRWAL